jgi:RNA polymerase sigma-70 factor (ECF subfamily)
MGGRGTGRAQPGADFIALLKRFVRCTPLRIRMQEAGQQDSSVDWEGALVRRARSGDTRAFERLYREHAGKVYGLCLRMTRDVAAAEDCTQETFINAWRALDRFETRSSMATWLHRIAVNVVIGKRRKAAPLLFDSDTLGPAAEDQPVESEWTLETPLEVNEIEKAIDDLPDGARDVLVLYAIYGYSHAEAAEMLGVAEGTCKAQLHRARGLLRDRLGVEVH